MHIGALALSLATLGPAKPAARAGSRTSATTLASSSAKIPTAACLGARDDATFRWCAAGARSVSGL
ncbi:hypothetical protein [Arthrobacter ramosus]|uniref:hypothetical protein n=1 Tax=Arthrobacter ramosus TaxID=1672 RepID=UPI001F302D2E|nr:hypothetical protein [Arthrobacter ramosus]